EALQGQTVPLLTKYRREWLAEVPRHLRGHVEMGRGFPGRLAITPKSLQRHGPSLVQLCPITEVVFIRKVGAGTAAELARLPLWSRIRTLDLAGAVHEKDRALRALLTSPHLTNLRQLDLTFNSAGEPEVRALADFPGLGRLEGLNLNGNGLNARSLAP